MAEQKQPQKNEDERIVRILSKDIEGKMKIYVGLTKIKGISWALSNAICRKVGIEKSRKIGSLDEREVEKISLFAKKMEIPSFMKNRRKDFETGEDSHLIGVDLDLKKEFDIKRLKKIRIYRGFRHLAGLPLRGQRTKANFRKNRRKGAGIKNKNKKE